MWDLDWSHWEKYRIRQHHLWQEASEEMLAQAKRLDSFAFIQGVAAILLFLLHRPLVSLAACIFCLAALHLASCSKRLSDKCKENSKK
jgi:hypothetical protein